jgi:hypothetical protein
MDSIVCKTTNSLPKLRLNQRITLTPSKHGVAIFIFWFYNLIVAAPKSSNLWIASMLNESLARCWVDIKKVIVSPIMKSWRLCINSFSTLNAGHFHKDVTKKNGPCHNNPLIRASTYYTVGLKKVPGKTTFLKEERTHHNPLDIHIYQQWFHICAVDTSNYSIRSEMPTKHRIAIFIYFCFYSS